MRDQYGRRPFLQLALSMGSIFCLKESDARPAFLTERSFSSVHVRSPTFDIAEGHTIERVPAAWMEEARQTFQNVPEYYAYQNDTSSILDDVIHDEQQPGMERDQSDAMSNSLENIFQPPSIQRAQISLAMESTAEMNQRLELGVSSSGQEVEHLLQEHYPFEQEQQLNNEDRPRGYKIHMHRPHTVRETIFHGKALGSSQQGINEYSPTMEDFVGQLLDLLISIKGSNTHSDHELELSLAMIYLDRASSIETSRNVPRCPFVTPRTVHRLLLTAILLAVAVVRNVNDLSETYHKIEGAFGISSFHCYQMVKWMRAALGDSGIFVTPDDMRQFKLLWGCRFAP